MAIESSTKGEGQWPWTYPKADVTRWAKQTSVLRFVGAVGGHGSYEDAFVATFRVHNISELKSSLASFGIVLKHNPNPPRPVCGQEYPSDDYRKFPNMIEGFAKEYEQPRWTKIKGGFEVNCYIQAIEESALVKFSVGGPSESDRYFTGDVDMPRIVEIDKIFQSTNIRYIDPPSSNRMCVCPFYFPEVWEDS